jgi:hypothetical protein
VNLQPLEGFAMKKILSMLMAVAAVAVFSSHADAKTCVNNNIQNNNSNSKSVNQNCTMNFSTNYQRGTGDNKFESNQTGGSNYVGSHQKSINGTNDVRIRQRNR